MGNPRHLFFLMNYSFLGFVLSAVYGVASSAFLWFAQRPAFQGYHEAFFVKFNCAISGGIVATTAILVFRTQEYIPTIIERTFSVKELEKTGYYKNRGKYRSVVRSLTFASSFAIVALGIFYVGKFPFTGYAEGLMIAFACAQYAGGVYIGRKLFYIAQMLRSVDEIKVRRDIFQKDLLHGVSIYVNAVSTLTIILVFVVVRSHYSAPFQYSSLAGDSIRTFMLIPAIIAMPILVLFNYYPRTVVRHLYDQSINYSISRLRRRLTNEGLTEFERLSYLVEIDKISRDELRYRLRMTLNDLPMAITIALALLSVIVGN